MTAPLHPNIPVGYWAAHPPGYVQSVDPGAVGAHKIWCDTSTTPYTWKIRNADNLAWVAIVGPTVYAGQAALEAVEDASIASDADLDARLVAIETGGAPPETHAATHAAAGGDPLTLATSQITGLDTALAGKASTAHTHGVTDLTATGTRDATTYLRGDNTWGTPAGGGGSVPHIRIETRTMPMTPGNYVEVGKYVFSGTGRKAALFDVAVQCGPHAGQGLVKHYLIAVSSQYLPSGFVTVRPDTEAVYTPDLRQAHLELAWDDTTVTFRLRQGYTQASTATINIRQLGDEAAFTYSALSGTGVSAASGEYLKRPSIMERVNRTVASAVGGYVEVGSFANWADGIALRVTVTTASGSGAHSVSAQYLVVASKATPTGWREVTASARALPASTRDCILEANVSATPTLDLRIAKAAGSITSSVHVLMEVLNNWEPDQAAATTGIPTFTAASGTGTSTASTATPWDNGERVAVRSVTATYTAGTGDRVIIADATSAAFTINLPLADFYTKGMLLYVRNKGTGNAVTLDGNGSQTIDGATTKAIAPGIGLVVACDGSAWHTFVG